MDTKPNTHSANQRLTILDSIINKLSRAVLDATWPNARDQIIKDIAYFNLYRRSVISDMKLNNFTASHGNRGLDGKG